MTLVLGPNPATERNRNVVIARPDWGDAAVLTASKTPESGTVLADLVTRQPSDCVGFDAASVTLTLSADRLYGADLDVVSLIRANATPYATWQVRVGDSQREADGLSAAEASGTGLRGELRGGASFDAGKYGGGLRLGNAADANDWLETPSIAITLPITIMFWANPDTLGDIRTLFTQLGFEGFRRALVLADGRVQIGTGPTAVSTARLVPSFWTHVACIFDGGDFVQLYLDGELQCAVSGETATAAGSGVFQFGAGESGILGFTGRMDDIRIYEGALDQATIQAEMASGDPATNAVFLVHYKLNGYQSAVMPFGAAPNDAEDALRDAFHLLPYRMNAKTLRIDVTDVGLGVFPIRFGRLLAGRAWQPSRNFDWGYALTADNDTKKTKTPTAATLSVERPTREGFDFTVKNISRREMLAEGYRLRKLLGLAGECLVCLDPGDDEYLQPQLRYVQFKELPTIAPDYYDGWRMSFGVEELR